MSVSIHKGKCIVLFGAASRQKYIFQSNRLKENVGASHLVKCAFERDLIDAIEQKTLYSVNTDGWDKYTKTTWDGNGVNIPGPQPMPGSCEKEFVEVIYIGGGQAALLCGTRDIANKVVKVWSRRLLKKAPGFRVTVGYGEVDDAYPTLAKAYRRALDDLILCEEALPFGTTFHGLPPVRTCISTGFPASELSTEPEETDQWISRVAHRKREVSKDAVTDELESILEEGQEFVIHFDQLGGSEGHSYIAVVHADGDRMGKWLDKVIDAPEKDDEKFIHNLRAFSASVSYQSLRALKATLNFLETELERLKDILLVDTKKLFPLRPIAYGGDDLTFVCDGHLGLSLAALYLQEFAKGQIHVLDKWEPVSACAGVAIVPTKFPFAQAYAFAEELCREAKNRRREQQEGQIFDKDVGCWLDFQIIQEGATKSIDELRSAQYRSLEGAILHSRPYQVTPEGEHSFAIVEKFQWKDFVEILKEFQSEWPRNRAKELLRALIQGSEATHRFVNWAQSRELKLPPSFEREKGWSGGDRSARETPYFDPLETLDFYVDVKPTTGRGTPKKDKA